MTVVFEKVVKKAAVFFLIIHLVREAPMQALRHLLDTCTVHVYFIRISYDSLIRNTVVVFGGQNKLVAWCAFSVMFDVREK